MKTKIDLSTPWYLEIVRFFIVAITFGICLGIPYGIILGLISGAIEGIKAGGYITLGAGLAFSIIMTLVRIWIAFTSFKEKVSLSEKSSSNKEEELGSALANHYEGGLAVGGKLILTTKGIKFFPHRINLTTRPLFISYLKIKTLEEKSPNLAKILSLGITSHLQIITRDKHKHIFVIDNPKRLINYLNNS